MLCRRWEQSLDAASPAEVTLLGLTLDTIAVGHSGQPGWPRKRSARLVADRGYASNPLRTRLPRRGLGRSCRLGGTTRQRPIKTAASRGGIGGGELSSAPSAWLGNFRRLGGRYEQLVTVYAGFFHLACALLTLRKVLK